MKPSRVFFAGLAVLVLLEGCSLRAGQAAENPQGTPVLVQSTEKPTGTRTPNFTPVRSPTLRPTDNLVPTVTPFPTISFADTATPMTTHIVVTIKPWRTIFYTPTVIGMGCVGVSVYPLWGQVFKPRTDFVAKWRVTNIGKQPWTLGDFVFGFVSGTKMQTFDRIDTLLPMTVYKGDQVNLQVHLVPPKEPGYYHALWGIRKTNKKDFFCTFDVNVTVSK